MIFVLLFDSKLHVENVWMVYLHYTAVFKFMALFKLRNAIFSVEKLLFGTIIGDWLNKCDLCLMWVSSLWGFWSVCMHIAITRNVYVKRDVSGKPWNWQTFNKDKRAVNTENYIV